MINISDINFKIVTTDYDNSTVKRNFQDFLETDDFLKEVVKKNPQLILSWKDKEVYNNSDLLADILIIDDEFFCILQYFKVINMFVEKEQFPIKNIIACTKTNAAHLVIEKIYENVNNRIKSNIPTQDPLLVFLDFELTEPGSVTHDDYLTSLVKKIFSCWESFDTEILGVSAYAFMNDPRFTSFQAWLRDQLIFTFPKDSDLFEEDRMMIHLSNYLLRNKIGNSEKDAARKEELEILEKLRNKHGKLKIDSTITLMDGIEKSIADLDFIYQEITLESLRVSNKDGGIYTTGSLKVEVGDKKNIIADLLLKSADIPSFTGRWNKLYHQIEIGCLFSRNIKPLIQSK